MEGTMNRGGGALGFILVVLFLAAAAVYVLLPVMAGSTPANTVSYSYSGVTQVEVGTEARLVTPAPASQHAIDRHMDWAVEIPARYEAKLYVCWRVYESVRVDRRLHRFTYADIPEEGVILEVLRIPDGEPTRNVTVFPSDRGYINRMLLRDSYEPRGYGGQCTPDQLAWPPI